MTLVRRTSSYRSARLLSGVLSLALALAAPAAAAASNTPGVSCSESSPSAVNQYCENIPSATGGHQVTPATPALATALPADTVRRLISTGPAPPRGRTHAPAGARQALLQLPAPGVRHELGSGIGAVSVSGWPLLWPAVAVVAAAGLFGAVFAARRRFASRDDAAPPAAE